MAKDPAFLFYSQDFYTGTATMSFEDKGKYIHILCLMHQQGRMNEETIRFCVGSVSVTLKSKFLIDENGFWYNERLETETEKRTIFTQSRRDNGNLGGRPKKNNLNKTDRLLKTKPKHNHMGDENENENENINDNKDEKEKAKKEKLEIIFPFRSDEFMELWDHWKKYKKVELNFSYKSPQSEQAALSELANLSQGFEETAMAIIRQSIAKGWKGFFELKITNNGTNKSTTEKHGRNSGAYSLADDIKAKFMH